MRLGRVLTSVVAVASVEFSPPPRHKKSIILKENAELYREGGEGRKRFGMGHLMVRTLARTIVESRGNPFTGLTSLETGRRTEKRRFERKAISAAG